MDVPYISKRRLVNLENIGEGAFGEVYKATLHPSKGQRGKSSKTVALKVLKDDSEDEDFQIEVDRMARLDHPNILKIIGTSTVYGDSCIITEYMPYGDLESHILNYPTGSMPAFDMVKFAYGIACGMKYLHHDIFPYELHCDLAARNCLVGPKCQIKIGDFGKFDSENDYAYYDAGNGLCPIRWMPPENVPNYSNDMVPQFTRKGDVWAFGVVLFEIWSKARLPYEGLSNQEVLDALEDDENPWNYFDVKARAYVLDLMSDCWEIEPSDRPNFKAIKREFEENDSQIVSA